MVIATQQYQCCFDDAFVWKSQPMTLGGRHPLGNVLLRIAILMAGASISKVLLVFKHMGLSVFSARTFFYHQKSFLFPAVVSFWKQYQAEPISKHKKLKNVVQSGDGRFNSMSHSAKSGAYSMFSNTLLKIVHFEILQVTSQNSNMLCSI